jgi:membrane-associated phospholipid phosphatase
MLYPGKCFPVSLLPFLLLTMPPKAAGVQSESQSGAPSCEESRSGNGAADEVFPRVLETAKPPLAERNKPFWSSTFLTLVKDHKDIWLGPSKIDRHQLPWLLPVVGATAAMTPFDTRVARALPNSPAQLKAGRAVSQAGTYYALGGLSATFYLAGRLTGSGRARETGILAAQALAHTESVSQMLKFAFGRERPDYGTGEGRFWNGQQSFPSGHAAGTWAVAAIVSREYHENKLLRYGIYALPVAVSAARVAGQRHYVSDVIGGALIGHLIGAFIYRRHHDPALGGAPVAPRSRAVPIPGLRAEPRSRTYALSLTWHP